MMSNIHPFHLVSFSLFSMFGSVCSSSVFAEQTLADTPDFTPIQSELFGVPGSLSNAWADIDNDGDLDFAVSIKGGEIRLYRNDEGSFIPIGAEAGLPQKGDEIRGLSWGDFDRDGDVDLVAGSNVYPTPSRTYVFQNNGSERFTEVAVARGLSIPGRWARQTNWIDFDNDGDLDLYAANRSGFNRLFVNDGQGQYSPGKFRSTPTDPRRTVGACWFDVDGDGDLDLFLANQSGDSDALWRNDGAYFTDIASELGMDQTERKLSDGGVGCAVGDYDNDGDFDLYVAAYGDNLLYRNNGKGKFKEVGKKLGVTGPDHTVAAAWGDYDNDGDLDLMSVGYVRTTEGQTPLNYLYQNNGKSFINVLDRSALLNAADHGVEWIDYDNDGDLDLSVTDGYGSSGGHFLFRNELTDSARARGLAVLVLGPDGEFNQAGAEVRLLNRKNKVIASRIVSTGGGYNTQSATPVYFAADLDKVEIIELRFMSADGGFTQQLQKPDEGWRNVLEVRRRNTD